MTVSTQIQGVVVAWQIYDITHDPLSLGLMGLAEVVPLHRHSRCTPAMSPTG